LSPRPARRSPRSPNTWGVKETPLGSWVARARRAGTLGESEREELARLQRQDAEKNKRIRELEMDRDVLKRCMVLWVK
jgi:transposase